MSTFFANNYVTANMMLCVEFANTIFSERELTFRFAICYRRSVCLSSVFDVGAPYSAGLNFRQFFFWVWYLVHPLTSMENFTEIVPGDPLRRGIETQGG